LRYLIVLSLLIAPAFAQGPRIVQPVRVSIVTLGDELNTTVAASVRAYLQRQRDVVIVSHRADVEIQFNALDVEGAGTCRGYFAAVLIVRADSPTAQLTGQTSGSIDGLAKELAGMVGEQGLARKGRRRWRDSLIWKARECR